MEIRKTVSAQPIQETIVDRKLRQWKQLTAFLEHWYYKPDIDAVKICLATYVAHTYLTDDPVWLFVIGVPGSGKTSIALRSVGFLENTHELNNLTTSSFLSGFGENNGILPKLTRKHGGNGVLLFPDFTTLLTKKTDMRDDIVGQLRPIYDGKTSKECGNKNESITWKGKVTVLAAVTPAIEDYWQLNRNLGERFLYVRWRSARNKEAIAEKARKQTGKHEIIMEEFQRRVVDYVDVDNLTPVIIPDEQNLGLSGLAWVVAQLRASVKRERVGNARVVSGVDEPEDPTRISKALTAVARASATLDRRSLIDWGDVQLAKRVANDSIPSNRRYIFEALTKSFNYTLLKTDLANKTKTHHTLLDRTIEDLRLLEIVNVIEGAKTTSIALTPAIIKDYEATLIATVDQ